MTAVVLKLVRSTGVPAPLVPYEVWLTPGRTLVLEPGQNAAVSELIYGGAGVKLDVNGLATVALTPTADLLPAGMVYEVRFRPTASDPIVMRIAGFTGAGPVNATSFVVDAPGTVASAALAAHALTPHGGSAPDATTAVKGLVQLAGDLAGTATAPTVPGLAGKETPAGAQAKADAAQGFAVQRANHTGTQTQSTVTGLVADLAAKAAQALSTHTVRYTAAEAATVVRPTGWGHIIWRGPLPVPPAYTANEATDDHILFETPAGSIGDLLGLTDATAAVVTYARTIADTLGLVDAASTSSSSPGEVALGDLLGIADAAAVAVTYARTIADTLGLVDAASTEGAGASAYLLEDGSGRYLLEDGSGVYLLEA